ncbi:hypothetical protein [Streptomyces chartreusis]
MAKTSGLGDNYYVGGYNVSGDINSLGKIGGGPAALEFTGIDKSAFERKGGLRDGSIEFVSYFNPSAGQAHPVLAALPTVDIHTMYMRGTAIGNDGACLVGKQANYDGSRADDGGFTFQAQVLANSYGLEWGTQLTAGLRTDTSATNGTSFDTGASASFGAQAYLQVTAFTGTSVTVKIQDSADNSSFADVSGLSFAAVSSTPNTQRLQLGATATVRRYVRAVTTGTFSSATFAVVLNKNAAASAEF